MVVGKGPAGRMALVHVLWLENDVQINVQMCLSYGREVPSLQGTFSSGPTEQESGLLVLLTSLNVFFFHHEGVPN